MASTAANNKTAAKAKPRGKPWPKGVSGNPKGRAKDGQSWAGIIREVGEMYPEDLLAFIPTSNPMGQQLAQLPKGVQLKYQVVIRVYLSQLFEPSGLFKELLDRLEGKVKERVEIEGGLHVANLQGILDRVYGATNTDSGRTNNPDGGTSTPGGDAARTG
jgi:hypothetical protein